jgi:hypothetical protein
MVNHEANYFLNLMQSDDNHDLNGRRVKTELTKISV